MIKFRVSTSITVAALVLAGSAYFSAPAAAQTEIVLHAKNASPTMGDWQVVADATAAGGSRMWNPDRGRSKMSSALASPYDYFELTFNAEAGRGYRLWVRGKADGNHWSNDSLFVQFSGATAYRIGTSDAATVSLEECTGCGSYQWGWNDTGWGGLGPLVYFSTTGPQRIRIQRREDGMSVDQIVLSASRYVSTSPGALRNDSTLLAETVTPSGSTSPSAGGTDIIIPVGISAALRGDWQQVADGTAARGYRVWNPDRGRGKLASAAANPTDYFEVTFTAEVGRPYRLWARGKAENDYFGNDSVFVQFNTSLTSSGSAIYRIGTTSATIVSIERGTGQGLGGWGWEDNGWDSLGPVVYFQTSGTQTLRVQRREDGVSIDQIVLSPTTYFSVAPGAAKWDTTLLAGAGSGSGGTTSPTPAPAPAPAPAPQPPPPTTSTTLRVMQWNIHKTKGTDEVCNPDRTANTIVAHNPDVVSLNEVNFYSGTCAWTFDMGVHLETLLEQKTGLIWYRQHVNAGGVGNVLLSKFPPASSGSTQLSYDRGVAQMTIVVNGRNINLFSTHVEYTNASWRPIQINEALRWLATFSEPRIFMGDFNTWPGTADYNLVAVPYQDAWTAAQSAGTATAYNGTGVTHGSSRFDYVFHSRTSILSLLSVTVPDTRVNGVFASDHAPVIAVFRIN